MRCASATGRARPALCRSAPICRTSAMGATRGLSPPVSAISASASALRSSCSVSPPNAAPRNRPSEAKRAAALHDLADRDRPPSEAPWRGSPGHGRRARVRTGSGGTQACTGKNLGPDLRMRGHDRRCRKRSVNVLEPFLDLVRGTAMDEIGCSSRARARCRDKADSSTRRGCGIVRDKGSRVLFTDPRQSRGRT
jgi:hypothetical protein